MKKSKTPKCKNCYLFDKQNSMCKISILIDGKKYNMPVEENDDCHMIEFNVPVEQVRWWVEDPQSGEKTNKNGIVKIEYPENFFGT
jgi:hypothetical protein